jgi:hypothetical protein
MSILSKTLKLWIPSNIIYSALKDIRLEKLFAEFFIDVKRKVIIDKINKEISFNSITQEKQIEIIETFKFKIVNNNGTVIEYIRDKKYRREQYSIRINSTDTCSYYFIFTFDAWDRLY